MSKRLEQEQRKYIRLDSIFPVQFRLISADGKQFLSDWLQGFTNNVSKGGICLSVNYLNPEFAKLIKERLIKFALEIEIPLKKNPVDALARVAWIDNLNPPSDKYIIGLSYENIDPLQNNRIMRYARTKKLFAPVSLGIIIVLLVSMIINGLINAKLIKDNKALVEQLVKVVQESTMTKQKIREITQERKGLEAKIENLKERIQEAAEERLKTESKAKIEKIEDLKKIEELNNLIKELSKERTSLEERMIDIQQREDTIGEELARLDKKKFTLEKANLDKMLKWLKVHQNPRIGLVMSFEGDENTSSFAFTYDQSLAAQAYTYFSDFERTKKVFDFFLKKAKKQEGQFLNAYYFADGSPAEYTVHSGPNIWLGIAVMQYTKKSQDQSYIGLAEEIAQQILNLQNQDREGGIRGGPGLTWFSTEHNLDAYAFFDMLYKITGKTKYQEAAIKILNWLVEHTYDKSGIPVKRGKGDSTIATDTYAWSIASLGPEKLEELGMDPDKILEFAEQNCGIEVSYIRPEGKTVKIKGFDFASQRHIARGGVISSEWTAQMIIAYKIMADFYEKKGILAKARIYALKADEYLSNLSNMIISSPSPSGQGESCIPYATEDSVDTGHGWITPKGKSTGSVAATAYTLFAYYNYNPLKLIE
jgi:hypothetical protein